MPRELQIPKAVLQRKHDLALARTRRDCELGRGLPSLGPRTRYVAGLGIRADAKRQLDERPRSRDNPEHDVTRPGGCRSQTANRARLVAADAVQIPRSRDLDGEHQEGHRSHARER